MSFRKSSLGAFYSVQRGVHASS